MPTTELATFMDQGQATWEAATGLLPYMRHGVQLPTAIVGLDVNDWSPIEARYNEMLEVLLENGESGHPFDVVRRAPPPPNDVALE